MNGNGTAPELSQPNIQMDSDELKAKLPEIARLFPVEWTDQRGYDYQRLIKQLRPHGINLTTNQLAEFLRFMESEKWLQSESGQFRRGEGPHVFDPMIRQMHMICDNWLSAKNRAGNEQQLLTMLKDEIAKMDAEMRKRGL